MRLDKLVKTTVDALEDIKGRDIVVLDVRKLTSLFDKIVIASADSTRQAKALSNNVQEKVKAQGAKVYGVEGEQVGRMGARRPGRRGRAHHAAGGPAALQPRRAVDCAARDAPRAPARPKRPNDRAAVAEPRVSTAWST